ncbi:helix-turn-helix domain-containing protein [Crossiella sp. CA-258035]|uniref:MarR family transcriptional regulator n=1 Tax=Crossiella sp. CA-258035 TaxID=2981138 RepID=UPI0024BC7F03|nr:helix-turn-helix domain-containing protein [Crossiella sp. CA-258035]WHT22832.1 helix-turn-helix domain-containing protein [Crossiella sp. CA-258035]
MVQRLGSPVALAPLDTLRVSVSHQAGSTLFSLLMDAAGASTESVPAGLRGLVQAALPAEVMRLLLPLRLHRTGIPDCLAPLADPDVETALGRLRDQRPDLVASQTRLFFQQYHGQVPPAWQRLIDRPGPYLAAFASAFEAIWLVYAPLWRRARPVLWRETERIGAAVVTGALPVALAVLGNHCWQVRGEQLFVDTDSRGGRADRRLVLTPLISGATAASFSLEHPDRIELAYPAPGLALVLQNSDAPPVPDALTALLGAARARILRHCAHHPTMTEVAALLAVTPATATHHCRTLEAAGLVERRRRGREVRLHRTGRGDAVVELFR